VTTPDAIKFRTGVFAAAEGTGDTYGADAVHLQVAPYSVFGPLRIATTTFSAGVGFEVAFTPGELALRDEDVVQWMRTSAEAVARYFGCFPVAHVMMTVVPVEGSSVRRGLTLGDGGASILVEVGRDATPEALRDDWVLPHEMVHLGFPSVSRRHHWIEEGVAVYVQPIARARVGQLPPEEVWKELALGLPKGLPRHADRGLDNTHTWGRTYWGGALFCLLADLEIRRRTSNRFSFDDALRGILAEGGSIAVEWNLERALAAGDAAVGVPVLEELYREMGENPMNVDLAALWARLGVHVRVEDEEGNPSDAEVTFDDRAPLAALRRAITLPVAAAADNGSGTGEIAACRLAEPPNATRFVRNGVRRR
jgi:hypothetical protein